MAKANQIFRLAIGAACLSVFQVTIFADLLPSNCDVCAMDGTDPVGGSAFAGCNGTEQSGIIDENNPTGNFYKIPWPHIRCYMRTPKGQIPCPDLLVGCCPSTTNGYFFCNTILNPSDCGFSTKCSGRCCPTGTQDTMRTPSPKGCTEEGQALTCIET